MRRPTTPIKSSPASSQGFWSDQAASPCSRFLIGWKATFHTLSFELWEPACVCISRLTFTQSWNVVSTCQITVKQLLLYLSAHFSFLIKCFNIGDDGVVNDLWGVHLIKCFCINSTLLSNRSIAYLGIYCPILLSNLWEVSHAVILHGST